MELTYQNITIRNAYAKDAPHLARWWNDGSVMAHAGFPHGLGTSIEKIVNDLEKDSDDTRRRLILLVSDLPVGEMCYYSLGDSVAEIGIKICESSFQEKGIGRCALSLLIKKLFGMGYSKIVLDTDSQNLRAQHVYVILGFQKIRVNVNSWTDQLGNMRSSVDYALTAEKFVDFAV